MGRLYADGKDISEAGLLRQADGLSMAGHALIKPESKGNGPLSRLSKHSMCHLASDMRSLELELFAGKNVSGLKDDSEFKMPRRDRKYTYLYETLDGIAVDVGVSSMPQGQASSRLIYEQGSCRHFSHATIQRVYRRWRSGQEAVTVSEKVLPQMNRFKVMQYELPLDDVVVEAEQGIESGSDLGVAEKSASDDVDLAVSKKVTK